jgi:hypothetical protein
VLVDKFAHQKNKDEEWEELLSMGEKLPSI